MASILIQDRVYELSAQGSALGQEVDFVQYYRCNLVNTIPFSPTPTEEEFMDEWVSQNWTARLRSVCSPRFELQELFLRGIASVTRVIPMFPRRPYYKFNYNSVNAYAGAVLPEIGTALGQDMPLQNSASFLLRANGPTYSLRGGKHLSPIMEADLDLGADPERISALGRLRLDPANDVWTSVIQWTPPGWTAEMTPCLISRNRSVATLTVVHQDIISSRLQRYQGSQDSRKKRPGAP